MAESSIFWTTSGTGDGTVTGYTQTQLFDWMRRTLLDNETTEGVLASYGNELRVTGSATPLAVNTGAAVVYGVPYENTASVNLAITTPVVGTTGGHVILRASWAAQTVRLVAVRNTDGTAATPALTQTAGTTWEIRLATFSITTGAVITLTDARDFCHFATAHIFRRQGGASANDWRSQGTTNYNVGSARIQVGAISVGIGAGAASAAGSVTYPVAYNASTNPIVFTQTLLVSGSKPCICEAAPSLNTGFSFTVYTTDELNSPLGSTVLVYWMAIGPELSN